MGEIVIDPFDCQACGMCALECPVQAIEMELHPRGEIIMKIEAAMSRLACPDPVIVGFFDLHGHFGPSDIESFRHDYPNVVPVMVFGVRRIDAVDILKAFELGARAVFLAKCPLAKDPFPKTRQGLEKRTAGMADLLNVLGLNAGCLAMCDMPEQGFVDKAFMEDLEERVQKMAPNPLRAREG
jgi:coenzyme F420-reducing hydrogenase delta subunit